MASLINRISARFELIIVDCLTLFISGLLMKGVKEEGIENEINKMMRCLKKAKSDAFIVSNEVGMGIVPKNKLAREFRDINGRLNQMIAGKSHKVFFIIAGLPVKIK